MTIYKNNINIIVKLNIYIGVEARDLYIDEGHMALDIFRFAVFS